MFIGFNRSDGSTVCNAEIVAAADTSQNQPTLLVLMASEAARLGEPRLQLLEGCSYEYQLSDPAFVLEEIPGIVRRSKMAANGLDRGAITTSLYVGTLHFRLLTRAGLEAGQGAVEVRSRKIDYRTEYRDMLSEIAEWGSDLIGSMSAITHGRFELEATRDNKTLQQKFFLLKSIVESRDFDNAISRIKVSPHTKLKTRDTERDVRRGIRPTAQAQREIASKQRRILLPSGHDLKKAGIRSLPARVSFSENEVTFDTPENRFVKYAIEASRQYIFDIKRLFTMAIGTPRARDLQVIAEMDRLISYLDRIGSEEPIKSCGIVNHINLGSPVLQQKSGYREILRYWIILQMATRLSWSGGEMVFGGARKNVATLYEYWCFVKLFNVVGSLIIFPQGYKDNFVRKSRGGLELNLARGSETRVAGHVTWGGTELAVELSFNRTFKVKSMRKEGSWTREMRPDITLSVWPKEFNREQAFSFGLLSMIHFDAKYKSILASMLSEPDEDNDITYSRDDLAKMHAYRDAIRRSEAAYILYPGSETAVFAKYEEILPGLGAIPLRPSDPAGTKQLLQVVTEVFENCAHRASRRAMLSFGENIAIATKSASTTLHELPFVGPNENGDFEPLNPRDRKILLHKAPDPNDVAYFTNGIRLSVRLDYVFDELLAGGLLGRLIFTYNGSGLGKLMRITCVSRSSDSCARSTVLLECKSQPTSMAKELLSWLQTAAEAQSAPLQIYEV